MAGINIPGVSDKYNTSETVEKLMQIERIPLTREQKTLETYKSQQEAWREVNRKMSSLLDSVKTLYSFDNPFNNKLASSSDEYAVTADAGRNAAYDSFKIDVLSTATADRFLTAELDADTKVPAGTYTYQVAEKTVTMKWSGGSLDDFSKALNKRGGDTIQSRVIGAGKGKKTLAIESLKTGGENRLLFKNDAETFAVTSGMIARAKPETTEFGTIRAEYRSVTPDRTAEQEGMPPVSADGITVSGGAATVPPRSGYSLDIPDKVRQNPRLHVVFSIRKEDVQDITADLNSRPVRPVLPEAGSASFNGVTVYNESSDTELPQEDTRPELSPVSTESILFAVMEDGSEKPVPTPSVLSKEKTDVDIGMDEYKGIRAVAVRNRNTGASLTVSAMSALNPDERTGYAPQHPITEAGDAVIKYEGITIRRPTNSIDDVVPDVTLNIHEKTDRAVKIEIKPDTEAAKDALITFVGRYNQAVAEINILSQSKPEIVDELDYLSDDEKADARKKLGMFQADSSLTSLKSNLQAAVAANYPFSDTAEITMLAQTGISTNAAGNPGYTPGKLRGYLEIDEKKIDSVLQSSLSDVKNIFGFDSDGDLIIDSGIGWRLNQQLSAYVQTGGILTLKASGLDSKIKTSEQRIARLETQLSQKEAELKAKYGQMEGALNSLENQQTTITNFTNQQNNRNR